ncbi:MAG: plasmid stabilization protein [Planctomycetaceae bacterium]|nr:plasmid stabilization protein [Planctomycetaceae bacterium]
MARIIRTRQARSDVLDIWEYIAADNTAAADKVIRRLDEVIRLLAEQPELGSRQDKYRVGLRCMPVGNYLIFYDQIPDAIRVLRILHGARRWEDLIQ